MKFKLFLVFVIAMCFFIIKNIEAQTWSNVGTGFNYPVNTFSIYNGNLIAGSDGIYQWDGVNWNDMNTGTHTFSGGEIYCLVVSNGGHLYCGGDGFYVLCPNNNLYNYIGRWDGSKWTTVGNGIGNDGSGMGSYVVTMDSYKGILYAGGNFQFAGGTPLNSYTAPFIASFAGISCCWSSVGTGMNDKVITSIVDTINNVLYVGGYFTNAGGVSANHIAMWDGSSWSTLGSGTNGKVTALCMHKGELYVGGLFTSAGGTAVNNIAKWDGNTWSTLGIGLDGQIYDLASYKGELYAGGDDFTMYNHVYIEKWDGTTWSLLGTGVDGYINKLIVFNNKLYVGGNFLNAGGQSANHIATWTTVNAIPETLADNSINIFPNPTTGKFTIESKGKLIIYNILGEIIFTQKLNSQKSVIDLSSKPKGVYFVQINNGNKIYSKKIVKQ